MLSFVIHLESTPESQLLFRSRECKATSCKVGSVNGFSQGGVDLLRKSCALLQESVAIAKKNLLYGEVSEWY